MNLKLLTEKKFGLPVYAWAAIAAVLVFGLYYLARKRGGSSGTSSADNVAPFPDSSTNPDYSGGGGGGGLTFPNPDQTGAFGGDYTPPDTTATTPTTYYYIPAPSPTTPELTSPNVVYPFEPATSPVGSTPEPVSPTRTTPKTYILTPSGATKSIAPTALTQEILKLENPSGPKATPAQQEAAQTAGQSYLKSLPATTLGVKSIPTSVPTVDKKGKTVTTPPKSTSKGASGAAQAKKTGVNTQAKARAY